VNARQSAEVLGAVTCLAIALVCVSCLPSVKSDPVQLPSGAAAIRGQVKDQWGATLAQAVVTLFGPGGIRRRAVTDDQGRYIFEGLPPGRYELKATATGFNNAKRTAVVETGATIRVDLEVKVI